MNIVKTKGFCVALVVVSVLVAGISYAKSNQDSYTVICPQQNQTWLFLGYFWGYLKVIGPDGHVKSVYASGFTDKKYWNNVGPLRSIQVEANIGYEHVIGCSYGEKIGINQGLIYAKVAISSEYRTSCKPIKYSLKVACVRVDD